MEIPFFIAAKYQTNIDLQTQPSQTMMDFDTLSMTKKE